MTVPRRTVAIVTGSRAEFGLLDPIIRAVRAHTALDARVIVAGAHLLPPAETWRDIASAGFEIAARVEMQRQDQTGRSADAAAVGRGIEGFARVYAELRPEWVLVLGDRIEAFAAAAAASIAGLAVAHLHGGDRAEGIADEAMRHAITKLAHLHLAATEHSAQRILRMGERPEHVHNVGSPAIDGLASIAPMSDAHASEWRDPAALLLMHPSALDEHDERAMIRSTINATASAFAGRSVLCLAPNHDPGRDAILDELTAATERLDWPLVHHLQRPRFIALLKRLASRDGLMIGNSSAALIEASALGLPAVNIGPRQRGRERPNNVIDAECGGLVHEAIAAARALNRASIGHPYGEGRTGPRVADLLSVTDPSEAALLRKRCAY